MDRDACEFCGKTIAPEAVVVVEGADRICTGYQLWTTNPFAVEIHDDYKKHWICPGKRVELADDV